MSNAARQMVQPGAWVRLAGTDVEVQLSGVQAAELLVRRHVRDRWIGTCECGLVVGRESDSETWAHGIVEIGGACNEPKPVGTAICTRDGELVGRVVYATA